MKNNFHNDIDKDNLDIANMILDDSKKIDTDNIFNENLLDDVENSNSKKKFQFKKVHALATAVAACLVILVGIGYWNSNNSTKQSLSTKNGSNNSPSNIASDYSEIYNKMISAVDVYSLMMYDSLETYSSLGTQKTADTAAPSVSATSNNAINESAEVSISDYYDTNEQTKNVHEGDIVKTDGEYIYTLTRNEDGDKYKIIITKANGMKLDNVAVINIPSKKKINQYIFEIYVSDNRLIAVGTQYEKYKYSENIIKSFIDDCLYGTQTIPVTVIYSYNISDKKNPELISTNQQDGSYNSSRLSNGYLYTISNKNMDKITKENCVPTINGKLMSCDCIYLPEQIDDQSYTVVTSLDIKSADDFSNSIAIAGGTSLIYASQNNLYLISNDRKDKDITQTAYGKKAMEKAAYEIAEPEKVEVDNELKERLKEYYKVLDYDIDVDKITAYKNTGIYEYTKSLNIIKYSYDGADINFVADTSVDGYSYDNMNFDEYKGYLRLVTTESSDTCIEKRTTYYDADGELLFYTNDYERSVKPLEETSNVFVLDEKLNKKSEIDNIAKGESLYSSRFLGDYGYFVTYENTDPLFSVDFSDMENPKIIGKLKLPGFSNYLHFYTGNLLFGFGSETDEETGNFKGLKMEMYNVANGKASQECKLVLDDFDYSPAEEDYKAIMIDSKKGLIGFAASSYEFRNDHTLYLVYTYKNNKFKKLFEIELENDYDIRGFYIGDYFYIVDPADGIRVLNIKTYAKDKKVGFEEFLD